MIGLVDNSSMNFVNGRWLTFWWLNEGGLVWFVTYINTTLKIIQTASISEKRKTKFILKNIVQTTSPSES